MNHMDKWSQVLFNQSYSGRGMGKQLGMIGQVVFSMICVGLILWGLVLGFTLVIDWLSELAGGL